MTPVCAPAGHGRGRPLSPTMRGPVRCVRYNRRRSLCVALALSLCAAAPARAASSPQALAVVERWIAATGGRPAFLADTALHVKGRLVSQGLAGTFEYWSWGPDRLVQRERNGTIQLGEGYDGVSGWRTDREAGPSAPLEGKDLEAIRADAWFLSEQWARDDQGGATIRLGQNAYSGGRSFVALEVRPPVGPPRTLWFDEKTGLLSRATCHRDQYSWNETFGGWRTLAGRKRWTVASIGDSALFAAGYRRQNVDSVRVEAPRDPALFSAPKSRQRPVTWLGTRGVARLPFHYRRGHVWVRASINGRPPADFVLDTGCTGTAIDRAYANAAGLELEGQMATEGVGGVDTGGWSHLRAIRLTDAAGRGVEVPDLLVSVLRINDDMERLDWDDTAGLIGYDVLSRFVVELDFDRQVVTLYDPATFHYAGAGTALPFTLWQCIPVVDVTLNGTCHGRFIVDVGNATPLAVHSEHVDACRLFSAKRKEIEHWVGGIGGALPEMVCRLDSLQIGTFRWSEPVAGLTLHHIGIAGSKDVQGNIGTSVLDRFKCTFDYAHARLWLEPGRRFAARDRFTRSGVFLVHWSGRVYVAGVVRHSPGEEAGLKVRDAIMAVDGRPIERWTPEALMALFDEGAVGRVVKLTIERDLRNQDIELTLADVL